MTAFFLYHRTTAPTGRVLAEAMRIPSGREAPSERVDVLIRWGSEVSVQYRAGLTLNPRNAIVRATNKLHSLEVMREAGVVVPDFATLCNSLAMPVLGRSVQHTRGQDIQLCLNQEDARRSGAEYFVKYIPTAREYRARVVGDSCVRVSEKVLTDPERYVPYCRNYETGYVFMQPRTRLNAYQEAMAVAAVRALGLHFGAVDLVVGDDGHTYVLEVNTAPALAPRSAAAMVGGMVSFAAERGFTLPEPSYDLLDVLNGNDDGDTEDQEVDCERCMPDGLPATYGLDSPCSRCGRDLTRGG